MYTLANCALVEKEHQKNKRQYAHVFHINGQVCLARAFTELPERFRLGIVMHEYGHILAGPQGDEQAANNATERKTAIPIHYGPSRHGLNLEYIDERHFNKARDILKGEFR
jgi:hypothetical protein